jgi:hypothetical protein
MLFLVGKLGRPCNEQAVILQRRIKWMENYSRGYNNNDLKQLKAELAELLEQDAKPDKLKCLVLCQFYIPQPYIIKIQLINNDMYCQRKSVFKLC